MKPPKPTVRAGDLQPPTKPDSSSSALGVLDATDGDCKSPALASPSPSVFFNKDAPVRRYRNWLPHWRPPGKWYFVTFRLADSLAQVKLEEWAEEREIWLQFHPQPWSEKVEQEYHRRFTAQFERWLDAGEGECVLRQPEAHAAVALALKFFAAEPRAGDLQSPSVVNSSSSTVERSNPAGGDFRSPTRYACAGGLQPPSEADSSSNALGLLNATDGDCKSPARDVRYELGDFVVMPNHVHLLVRRWETGSWRSCSSPGKPSQRKVSTDSVDGLARSGGRTASIISFAARRNSPSFSDTSRTTHPRRI